MRNVFAAATAVAMTVALAACGSGSGQPRSAVPPSSTAPSLTPPTSTAAAVVAVTEADSGRTVTLAIGQRLEIYLQGTPAAAWSPPVLSGSALAPAPSGRLALRLGVTGAAFTAVRDGEAHLSSTRAPCTGQDSCPLAVFDLTVRVA